MFIPATTRGAASRGVCRSRALPAVTAGPWIAPGPAPSPEASTSAACSPAPGSRASSGLAGTRGRAPPPRLAMAAQASAATAASASTVSPAELWRDITQVYDRAMASGACSKTDTQVEVLHDPSLAVDFVLRVAAALKAKPTGLPAGGDRGSAPSASAPPPPWRNPFSPPEPALTVRPLGPGHVAVLNKFNVVPHHVLVLTNAFRSQAEPLDGGDLAAALEVVKSMPEGGVAFYNCGPESGRSQPHKHLQVVPLPFAEGQPPAAPLEPLVAVAAAGAAPLQPLELRALPYRCYVAMLPDSPSPDQLQAACSALLQRAFPGYTYTPHPALAAGPPTDAATAAAVAAGPVSYNVLMTRRWLLLAPRRQERCGPLALNSLAFAGTVLVRSEEELGFVRETGPANILAQIGVPW